MLELDGPPVAMNALAKRAGVGVGTVYRHFPTSHDLLGALAADALGELEAEIAAAAAEGDPWRGIERVVAAQVRVELDGAGVREVLAASTDESAAGSLKEAMAVQVDDLLARAWDAGRLTMRLSARHLRDLLCGVGYAAALAPEAERRRAAELYAQIVLRGLRR